MRIATPVVLTSLLCGSLIAAPARAQSLVAPDPTAAAATGAADCSQPVAAAPCLPVPSFSQIFTQTARDFTHLPSKQNAIWLGLGAAITAASAPLDQRVSARMHAPPGSSGFFVAGSMTGNVVVHLGAGFASYAFGRGSGNARLARFGADLVRAQLVTQGTTLAVKLVARRTRPDGSNHRSFPSGHTATTFATATVVERRFGWKWGIAAYAAGAYVGASRVQMRKHYLSDVVFGATLGVVAGRTVTIGSRRATFAVEPMAVPGGGGIQFRMVK